MASTKSSALLQRVAVRQHEHAAAEVLAGRRDRFLGEVGEIIVSRPVAAPGVPVDAALGR